MNNSIQILKEKLDKVGIKYILEKDSITVPVNQDKGFQVALHVSQNGFTVSFKGWHEAFKSQDEAFGCFKFGLSNKCRLKVFLKGDFEYKWVVEHQKDGKWLQDSETGLLVFPFWKKECINYFQNSYFQD